MINLVSYTYWLHNVVYACYFLRIKTVNHKTFTLWTIYTIYFLTLKCLNLMKAINWKRLTVRTVRKYRTGVDNNIETRTVNDNTDNDMSIWANIYT